MKQFLVAGSLALCPGFATAQTLTVDESIVRSCFENTSSGAVFPTCLGQASSQCEDTPGGSTTLGIGECIAAETAVWDAILNEEYAATQAENAKNDEAYGAAILDRTDALRDAQRAWIAFRDADCAARYAIWQDGTIRSIVGANCLMTMTASRAIALRDMRAR